MNVPTLDHPYERILILLNLTFNSSMNGYGHQKGGGKEGDQIYNIYVYKNTQLRYIFFSFDRAIGFFAPSF